MMPRHAQRHTTREGWCLGCCAAELLVVDNLEEFMACDVCGSEDVEALDPEALEAREYVASEVRFILATLDTAITWWGLGCPFQGAAMLRALVRGIQAWEPEEATLGEWYGAAMALRDSAEAAQ